MNKKRRRLPDWIEDIKGAIKNIREDIEGLTKGQFLGHARGRMTARAISEALLRDIIETGAARYKDETRLWIAKHYGDRVDNLLCVAAVLETALVIKTVKHHFSWGCGS
jgi:hypothetical protein